MATTFSAAAFRAACDIVLTDSVFIEEGLGFRAESASALGTSVEELVDRVLETLPPIDEQDQFSRNERIADVRALAVEALDEVITQSPEPLTSSVAAEALRKRFGAELGDDWMGAGSFKGFVERLPAGNFQVNWQVPGYFWDPERHAPPQPGDRARNYDVPDLSPEANDLAKRLHRSLDIPLLSSQMYRDVFDAIALYATSHDYYITDASKALRDEFLKSARHLSRAEANYILVGTFRGGYQWPGQTGIVQAGEAIRMTMCYANNVIDYSASMDWDEENRRLLLEWLLGAFDRRAVEAVALPAASEAGLT